MGSETRATWQVIELAEEDDTIYTHTHLGG